MKNTLTLASLLLIAAASSAQHTIDQNNGVLDLGESIIYNTADPATFASLKGSSGVDRTWDFSSLVSTGTITVEAVDSAGTPENARGVAFAEDVALRDIDRWIMWEDFAHCYRNSSNGLIYVGRYNDVGGSLGPWAIVASHQYDNADCIGCEVEMFDYPATFGDKVSSSLRYTWSDQTGAVFYYDGDVDVEIDAHGTLTMPGGLVLEDVMRIEIKENWDEMSNFGGMGTKLDDVDHLTYEYRVKDNKSPLIRHEYWTGGAFHTTNGDRNKFYFMDASSGSLGSNTIFANLESVKLFPNPSHNQTHIAYNLTKPSTVEINVLDISGKRVDVVFNGEQEAEGYNLPYRLDNLDQGSYLVEVIIDGERTTRKLMVR